MAQNPEQELADFLAPLPRWLQKALWYDYSSMTDSESWSWLDSINPFTADQLQELKANPGWQPERYPHSADELRPRFEQIVQRCGPAEWKRYRDNAKSARAPMPRSKPGRKPNDELAERIWTLSDAGMTARNTQEALKKDGINLTPEAVEYYKKTRRRQRKH